MHCSDCLLRAKPIKTCQFKSKGTTGSRHHHPHIDFPLIHKRVESFAPPTPKEPKEETLPSVCLPIGPVATSFPFSNNPTHREASS